MVNNNRVGSDVPIDEAIAQSRSAPRIPKQPKWHLLYFVLAALDILAVSISLFLHNRTLNIYSESVALNQTWAQRLALYSDVSYLAGKVNAPGNDLFDSRDRVRESARKQEALRQFGAAFENARADLKTISDSTLTSRLLGLMDRIDTNMSEMVAESEAIFTFFAQNRPDKAGERMATMDRKYAAVNEAFATIEKAIRKNQGAHLNRQLQAANSLRRWEMVIAGMVALMIAGVTFYGHRLSKVVAQVTKEREEEVKLKIYAAELKRSNRELADFASVASHDLQEPLRKIQAFGGRLKSKCGPAMSDEERDYLERMQKAAIRMRALIDDLMMYSRVTATAQSFVSVDLAEVARQVLTDLEVSIEQKDAHVEVGNVPKIEAVPLQMRQLLQNLIDNALKFHRKEEAPVVRITGELLTGKRGQQAKNSKVDNLCKIMVQDRGIGFDEKYLDRIFTLFQRLHGRNQYEGTGMGLAICRKICELHNGSITAKSKPGQGATFIVTLPVKQPNTGNSYGETWNNGNNTDGG